MIKYFDLLKEKRLQIKGQKLLTQGKIEKAFDAFQKAILINSSTENIYNLALSLMAQTKYLQAEKYLRKIFENYPENEMNLLTLAECVIMQKKWNEAIELYRSLADFDPENKTYQKYKTIAEDVVIREKYVKSKYLLNFSILELKRKNDKKAMELLLEAEEYFPGNPNILNNIGSIYMLFKNYEKAYSYFSKAIENDPSNKRFQKNLFTARKKLKNKLKN